MLVILVSYFLSRTTGRTTGRAHGGPAWGGLSWFIPWFMGRCAALRQAPFLVPVLAPTLAAVSPPAAGRSMAIAMPQGNVVAMSAGPNPHRQIRQRPAGRRYPTAPQQSVGGLFDAVFAAFGTFLNGLMDPAPTADPRRPEPSADTPKADIETPAEQDEKQKHPRLDIRL